MFNCLGFKSIYRSFHWKNESLDICLVKDHVGNLWNVNWSFISWNVLFNMDKSYLRDFNWMFFGGNNLFDDHKVYLRNFDGVFISWYNLLDRYESDLR